MRAVDPSLTARERRDHELINGSRRKRIARGSGTTVQEVNNLLRQYTQMQKMFKSMGWAARLMLCERCETRAMEGKRHCWFHVAQIDEARRKRTGHKPWQPGSRSRPPLRG
jgi:signal recognition particle GTPase